jgi:hypothetical protein
MRDISVTQMMNKAKYSQGCSRCVNGGISSYDQYKTFERFDREASDPHGVERSRKPRWKPAPPPGQHDAPSRIEIGYESET